MELVAGTPKRTPTLGNHHAWVVLKAEGHLGCQPLAKYVHG